MSPQFSPEELHYYQRQMLLPELGPQGQAKLKAARVLVVGAGGLGCPVLLYLAAAGVGRLGIADGDTVSLSNLHRQVLYTPADVGRPKAQVASQRLAALNPHIEVVAHAQMLTSQNALALLTAYDLVIDCSDNFATRYLVNDACVLAGKPFVFGAIHRAEGQVAVFNLTPRSATYRCLFPQPPEAQAVPNCAEAGVLGLVAGLIGLYQANEAVKILTGTGQVLDGQLLAINLADHSHVKMNIRPKRAARPVTQLADDYAAFCHETPNTSMKTIDVHTLATWLAQKTPIFLLDVRETYEYDICHLENAFLIPMGQIPERLAQIPTNSPIVVYCHHGVRSAHVIRYIEQNIAHEQLYNLEGGIHAWACDVQPDMPIY